MLKGPLRKPWTCARCLQKQQRISKRCLVTSSNTQGAATAAAVADDYHPVSKAAPSTSHDDKTLRQIFDSSGFWKDFSPVNQYRHSGKPVGLLQNRYLTKPEGFQTFAEVTLQKCKKIVMRVLAYQSVEDYKRIAQDLDRLSDLLCRVIDLSDFIRSVHPDRKVQAAANEAYATMFEYMNVLNTTTGLNEQLKKAMSIAEVYNSWSEEERTVATILEKDFSKSAVDLADSERRAFVEISNEIVQLGNDFVDNMAAAQPYLNLQSSKLKGMDPVLVRQITKWGGVSLPTVGMPAQLGLRTVEDAETRKEIYIASRTSEQDNLLRLEQMLKRRAELAKLGGFESFAHMTLADKMARSPEAVTGFLNAMAGDNASKVQDEFRELLELKRRDAQVGDPSAELNAWDKDYYTNRLLSSIQPRSRAPADSLSAYFSLGTVMQGLSRLFHRLYGLRLVPRETQPGETWNPDVRRLDVVDDHEGHIAVIYCDLFERAGKSPNPAHFTLRCSRRISKEEIEDAASLSSGHDSMFATAEEAANDGLATAFNPRDGNSLYQLPTIALICDFQESGSRPTLLTFRELTTLFHEMGHALHSICGRTALQNVSGTRCATDFAELPSVLMESFVSALEVLGLWARHWQTDKPLDIDRVMERVEVDRRMAGAEVEGQVLLAMLDQRLHSSLPLSWSEGQAGQSTEVYRDVWNTYSSTPEPAGTSWQGFFGHLFGYGATYYSYLFDRAIAGKIWKDVFQRKEGGAIDPEAGFLFREEMLRWGGGRDGWKCVAGALRDRDGVLAEGGKGAMEMVGGWGVRG